MRTKRTEPIKTEDLVTLWHVGGASPCQGPALKVPPGLLEIEDALEPADCELPDGAATRRKGSLRSHPNGVDVSAIARSFGGGGHRRAAGFSTDLPMDEITERIVGAFTAADGHPDLEP